MNESSIFGVSIRGIIAMFTVVAGFVFVFAVTFGVGGDNIVTSALVAVTGFVSLVLGFYFGQKSQPAVEDTVILEEPPEE
jgi:hypothetical protein